MRFIIYGVGAIGGTIAASLALAGKEVIASRAAPSLRRSSATG
ncbi:MAG: hypothetical protein WDN31_11785 [Hyphomicrobium sp.]